MNYWPGAAVPVGGGGAWPGSEPTRRASRLAARTASGRAAAHGCTKQPGPTMPPLREEPRHAARPPRSLREEPRHAAHPPRSLREEPRHALTAWRPRS